MTDRDNTDDDFELEQDGDDVRLVGPMESPRPEDLDDAFDDARSVVRKLRETQEITSNGRAQIGWALNRLDDAVDDAFGDVVQPVFTIDFVGLFGHIPDDRERHKRAEEYAESLATVYQDIGDGDPMVLPDEVEFAYETPSDDEDD